MGSSSLLGAARSLSQDDSVLKQALRPDTTKRMLKFAHPYAMSLSVLLLVVILDAFAGITSPFVYRDIINNGILKQDVPLVIKLAVLAGILGVVDTMLGVLQSYLAAKVGSRIVFSLRVNLFDHIQKMPLDFFTRAQTGALVSRLNTDVNGARSAFTDILSNVVGNIIITTLVFGAMFVLSWRITLAATALIPLFLFPARWWGRKLQKITRESYDLQSAMNNVMVERFNVAGAQLAKLFGRAREESCEFKAEAKRVCDITVTQQVYARIFFMLLMLTAYFATALAYGWGGVLAAERTLDVGTIVALVALLARVYSPLAGLSNIQVSLMMALVSFDRVFEVLDLSPIIQEKPNATTLQKGAARVSFDHVSFSYPKARDVSLASLELVAMPDLSSEKMVLREISFVAEPGTLVALVGPSGAGKTTITHLVPRLYDANSGSVSINGVDVREATLDSLHQRIGTVTQEPHLFHDTIRANLLYAKPDATEDNLKEALRLAQILALVESLPQGLDTLVGDHGYRFSGGEKQRLAIARLLLKDPDIVILDEATAHLDSHSEAAVQRALRQVLRGRTSLVIAHRLSTILEADQILVVQDGAIVDRGRHAQLLKRGGLYAELYRRQFALEEMHAL